MEKSKKTTPEIISKIVFYVLLVILVIYAISLLVPIYWLIVNSLKNEVDYFNRQSFAFPTELEFSNYKFILQNMEFAVRTPDGKAERIFTLPWMFVYSFLWAFCNTGFCVIFITMCAYVIAKYNFPGRNFLFNLGLVVMILPIIGSNGALLILRRDLGIYNNMLLMILTAPSMAFSGMNFMMLHANFKGIPWDYAEAVFIDGGGHLRVFVSIMLPMAMPTVWVVMLLGFIGAWNDYDSFMYWMPSYLNVAMGVYKFQYTARSQLGVSMPQILASFAIVAIPVVILYASVQKLITSKLVIGGLKG